MRVADGDAGAGPIAALPQSERFGWLVAPSSTIVQPSEVHTGLCQDPAADARRPCSSGWSRLRARLVPSSPSL